MPKLIHCPSATLKVQWSIRHRVFQFPPYSILLLYLVHMHPVSTPPTHLLGLILCPLAWGASDECTHDNDRCNSHGQPPSDGIGHWQHKGRRGGGKEVSHPWH